MIDYISIFQFELSFTPSCLPFFCPFRSPGNWRSLYTSLLRHDVLFCHGSYLIIVRPPGSWTTLALFLSTRQKAPHKSTGSHFPINAPRHPCSTHVLESACTGHNKCGDCLDHKYAGRLFFSNLTNFNLPYNNHHSPFSLPHNTIQHSTKPRMRILELFELNTRHTPKRGEKGKIPHPATDQIQKIILSIFQICSILPTLTSILHNPPKFPRTPIFIKQNNHIYHILLHNRT